MVVRGLCTEELRSSTHGPGNFRRMAEELAQNWVVADEGLVMSILGSVTYERRRGHRSGKPGQGPLGGGGRRWATIIAPDFPACPRCQTLAVPLSCWETLSEPLLPALWSQEKGD